LENPQVPINFAIKLAATVALEAMQMGIQAMQRTRGPRLSELSVSTAEFGAPLVGFLGTRVITCAVTHAEDLKEVPKTSKGKAGKNTTYSYLATFDATICDNPIEKVLKIWLDEHICYDVTGTGPTTPLGAFFSGHHADAPPVKLTSGKNMRIYLGGEDQLPDPRYVEYCEGKFGPDSAPASRGCAHIFFEEIPTDNFGNRIPQVKVLVATAAHGHYPVDTISAGTGFNAMQFTPDLTRLYLSSNSNLQVIDVPTRTKTLDFASNSAGFLAFSQSAIYTARGFPTASIIQIGYDGGSAVLGTTDEFIDYPYYVGDALFFRGFGGLLAGTYRWMGADLGIVATSHSFLPNFYFGDSDSSNGWAVGYVDGFNKVAFAQVTPTSGGDHIIDVTTHGMAYAMVNPDGKFLVWQQQQLFIVDPATWTASAPVSGPVFTSDPESIFRNVAPGAASIWIHNSEYSTIDGSLIRTVNIADWGTFPGGLLYDKINQALINVGSGVLHWLYLDRSRGSGVTDGDIVANRCGAAGMTDYDVSGLTAIVEGYSWTRGSTKAQLEPLLDIQDVDACPHDFSIVFRPRGGTPSGTILTADFARKDNALRYKTAEPQDTDLPKILRVNFADSTFDQQTNNVLSPLPADAVDSQRDVVIDLTTYVTTPNDAQQKADRYMRGLWNRRAKVENALTAQCLALEPADLTTLSLDGILWNCKLDKQTFVGTTRIECVFIRDEAAVATLNSATEGPPLDGRDPDTIHVPPAVRGFVVDAPLHDDVDADIRPLLYMGAGVYGQQTFAGAVIFEAVGAGADRVYSELADTVTAGATWGICNGTLASVPVTALWDRGNTLNVSLQSGTLTNVSEADIDEDPGLNLMLVGAPGRWEYVNFTTATLQGDGSWTLSGFKRGRRGTEWACGLHAAADVWLLANDLDVLERGSDDVGADLSFKAQSVGRDPQAAVAIDLDPYQGQTLMPWSPARLIWTTDGTDLFGQIIRRTRVGGAWVSGGTIPLSEASEAYSVDIYHGSTFKRTIAVTGTNLFTYTAAQMAADGNSVATPPPANVFQLSDAVGRGFALAA
jgi:hypothetical protein